MPNTALANRLRRTSKALDEAVSSGTPAHDVILRESGQASRASLIKMSAPALSRRIRDPEDSNKGRFGGKHESGGFKLFATFSKTRNKNWEGIVVTVLGKIEDGTVAEIFRHDSFKPKMRRIVFENGRADHKMTAWGGFTVGVWIPDKLIELELDLASLPGAPRIIAER